MATTVVNTDSNSQSQANNSKVGTLGSTLKNSSLIWSSKYATLLLHSISTTLQSGSNGADFPLAVVAGTVVSSIILVIIVIATIIVSMTVFLVKAKKDNLRITMEGSQVKQ